MWVEVLVVLSHVVGGGHVSAYDIVLLLQGFPSLIEIHHKLISSSTYKIYLTSLVQFLLVVVLAVL